MFSSFFESILPTVYADEQPASSSDAVEAKSDVNQVKEEKENEHTIEDHIEETAEEEEEEEEVEDVSRPPSHQNWQGNRGGIGRIKRLELQLLQPDEGKARSAIGVIITLLGAR